MKKPAGKKKAVDPPKKIGQGKRASLKKTGQGERTSVKKTSSSISEVAKKGVKRKPAGKPTRSARKAAVAADPSSTSTKRKKKTSLANKAPKRSRKTDGKTSSVKAKTTPRTAAGKGASSKIRIKTAPKKPVRATTGGVSPATKIPAKETKSLKTKKKVSLPESLAVPKAVPRELPREYGENEVILMSVDPHVIFVDWEIKKEQVPDEGTPIIMRVFDVSPDERSLEFHWDRFLDLHLEGRVGSGFFEIGMPGREVAIEIGLWQGENFSAVLKSEKVSMPDLVVPDELGIAQKLFESGVPVGY